MWNYNNDRQTESLKVSSYWSKNEQLRKVYYDVLKWNLIILRGVKLIKGSIKVLGIFFFYSDRNLEIFNHHC